MLGFGELIFVLVIVVQGVAAIAAASHKKKKRAAERAKEIAAEEARSLSRGQSPSPSPPRLGEESVSDTRARALQEREARKAKRALRQEEHLLKVQQFLDNVAGKGVAEAILSSVDRGRPSDEAAQAENAKVSVSADEAMAMTPAPSPPPMTRSSIIAAAPMQPAVEDQGFAAFEKKGRKSSRPGFSTIDSPDSSDSTVRNSRKGRGRSLRGALRDSRSLRQAIVLKTLLEPPVALRDEPNTVG